jgi:hypothetical protein
MPNKRVHDPNVFELILNIDDYNVEGLKGHFGKNEFLLYWYEGFDLFLMVYQRFFNPL